MIIIDNIEQVRWDRLNKMKPTLAAEITPRAITYAYEVMNSLLPNSTKQEAINYIANVKSRPNKQNRNLSRDLLAQSMRFLNSLTEVEIQKVFQGKYQKQNLKTTFRQILKKAVVDPDPTHIEGYVSGLMRAVNQRLKQKVSEL